MRGSGNSQILHLIICQKMSCCLTTVTPSTPWSRHEKDLEILLSGHLLNPLPHTLTHTPSQEGSHWVSFHFQQSRDELVWVTVVGKAAIFLALCLHSVLDELLRQHSNEPIRKPSENVSKGRTHCFLENSVSHESKDCVYDPKHMLLFTPSPCTLSPLILSSYSHLHTTANQM